MNTPFAAGHIKDGQIKIVARRCAKCGIFEDAPSRPYDDPKSICYAFVGYLGAPEPNGEHEFYLGGIAPLPEDATFCRGCGADVDENGNCTGRNANMTLRPMDNDPNARHICPACNGSGQQTNPFTLVCSTCDDCDGRGRA